MGLESPSRMSSLCLHEAKNTSHCCGKVSGDRVIRGCGVLTLVVSVKGRLETLLRVGGTSLSLLPSCIYTSLPHCSFVRAGHQCGGLGVLWRTDHTTFCHMAFSHEHYIHVYTDLSLSRRGSGLIVWRTESVTNPHT